MANPSDASGSASKIAVALLGAAALFVAGFLVWLVAGRIGFPYELEWMEGAMADHVCRVLAGERIYAPPSYQHVAFLYNPGFFYAAALVGLVTGPGFLALRLVSVAATIGSCVLIYRLARRDGDRVGAVAGVALFLAAFSLTGCYYDVGRIDPLFTCLLLWGVDRARVARTWRGLLGAGGLFLACWLTKQTAAVIVPFVILGCLPRGVRQTGVFGLAVAAGCGLVTLGLDRLHDGWLWYYTIELPGNHGVLPQFYTAYWTHDLLPLLPAIGLWVVFLWRGGGRAERVFHAAWIGGCVIGSYLSRLHVGGAENVLIPVVAALSVGAGLGVARLRQGSATGRVAAPLCGLLQVVVAFGLPWFGRPIPQLPSAALRTAWERQVAAWAANPAPLFLPWHGYVARLAGKPPTAHSMAMDDVWRSGNQAVIGQLDAALRFRLRMSPHPLILVDEPDHLRLRPLILGAGFRPIPGAVVPELRPPVGAGLWPRVVLQR